MPESSRQRLAPFVALLLLCLLWAAATLRSDLFPRSAMGIELSPLSREAVILGVFAGLATLAAFIRKSGWHQSGTWMDAILAGGGLFVVPMLLTGFGKTRISDSTRVALFSLTPLFAVVFEPYLGSDMAGIQNGAFVAALVAVGGTALVFPIEIPNSGGSFAAFCGILASAGSIAAANCIGVRATQRAGGSALRFAATAAASASLCLGALGMVIPHNTADSVALDAWIASDLLAVALLFWLIPRMSAVRMTTRFLIAPLFANMVGLVILRPRVQWQARIGLLLIALASGWLLFAPEGMPETNGKQLRLD